MPLRSRILACLATVALLLLSGCAAHVNHLRDAQAAFNEAATFENDTRVQPRASTPMAIQSGYSAVIVSLTKLEQDRDALRQLQQDKLYGNALALKALAYWRLRKYDLASAAGEAALREGLEPGTRDRALMIALPTLIRNDQAHARLYAPLEKELAQKPEERLAAITQLLGSNVKILDDATTGLEPQHPVQAYLATVGLVTMKNFVDACSRLAGDLAKQKACTDEGRVKCRSELYLTRLRSAGADPGAVLPLIQGTGADVKSEVKAC
jgi:hypothetical protein